MVAQPCGDDALHGRLVIITEAGIMNALQLYSQEVVSIFRKLSFKTHIILTLSLMCVRFELLPIITGFHPLKRRD